MRMFVESVETGEIVEITNEIAAAEVVERVVTYIDAARRYGLSETEIAEDIGGGGHDTAEPYDGFVKWAIGAEFRCGEIYLGDPGIFVDSDGQ